MNTLIDTIASFEHECLLEVQREGITITKEKGVYKGRKHTTVENFKECTKKNLNREIPTKSSLTKMLGISRQTLYNLIDTYNRK